MEIRYTANTLKCFGKAYIDNRNFLRVRQDTGDYAVIKNVDFGTGKRGLEILGYEPASGVSLVYVHLDSLDGRCIGVIACETMAFGNGNISWGEIEETKGFHDVYLKFEMRAGYRSFRFTNAGPHDTKDYTPIPDECIIDVQADTWEATDMLGRKVPSPEECPDRRDKKVGMFFWTWHERNSLNDTQTITGMIEDYPEAEFDEHHPAWKIFDAHWNEPLWGFYRDSDPYVIRKQLIMLSNAGVDYIAFDNTNGAGLMREAYTALFEQMRQAKLDGIKVPQFMFMMNFWPHRTSMFMLRAIYQDIYKSGLYEDLWYKIDGKPVVMAHPTVLDDIAEGEFDKLLVDEIKNAFTFRPGHPSYEGDPQIENEWAWLQNTPQHKFCVREDGSFEQMTVGVAQNRTAENRCTRFNIVGSYGRSYTDKNKHSLLTEDSFLQGYNFQEQWDYAIEADPDMIFVTGWNEWTAGRWHGWGIPEDSPQLAFVDQFDREHSRDIEPDIDGQLDTYYLQLCANIRKFKGTAKVEPASPEVKGEINWNEVAPTYRNHKGSTQERQYPGFGSKTRYCNRSMRNDITMAKVARDAEKLYFYASCEDEIVDTDKENCMLLFLNTDRSHETGWEGYNFRVAGGELQANAGTIKNGGYGWEKVADVKRTYNGNTVVIEVNKADLGLGDKIDFEFKWVDNCFREIFPKKYDVMQFYTHGVSAPFGRFNYRYKA